jgi:hypothetical protein
MAFTPELSGSDTAMVMDRKPTKAGGKDLGGTCVATTSYYKVCIDSKIWHVSSFGNREHHG